MAREQPQAGDKPHLHLSLVAYQQLLGISAVGWFHLGARLLELLLALADGFAASLKIVAPEFFQQYST